jgi:hypothetical protein
MYANSYLLQLIAEEHGRDMRSTAAAANVARQARRARRARSAAARTARHLGAQHLLRSIPQPRKSHEEAAHRAA